MNNDLISRSALKKEIEQYQIQWNKNCDIDIAKWNCCGTILAIIDNAPTVAVDEEIERKREELYQSSKKLFDTARMLGVERPKGEWVQREELFDDEETPRMVWGCNKCGFSLKSIHDKRNYCPNCGADMRGDENGKC
jgi:hypothetical protein